MAYANSVDPDQTAPEGAVWSGSTLFAILLNIFLKQLHKKAKFYAIKKVWNKVFQMWGHLPYSIFNIKTVPLIRPLLDSPKSGLYFGILLYINRYSNGPVQTLG